MEERSDDDAPGPSGPAAESSAPAAESNSPGAAESNSSDEESNASSPGGPRPGTRSTRPPGRGPAVLRVGAARRRANQRSAPDVTISRVPPPNLADAAARPAGGGALRHRERGARRPPRTPPNSPEPQEDPPTRLLRQQHEERRAEYDNLPEAKKVYRNWVREPFDIQIPTREEVYEADFMFRVFTFANYTGDNEYELALAGWSGTDHETLIFCENCRVSARDTYGGDNALHLHKLLSPDCEFVKDVVITDEIRNDVDTVEMLSRCRIDNFNY